MRRLSMLCLFLDGLSACASAGPEILRPGVLTRDASYALAFENPTYQRFAEFRDAIVLELRLRGLTMSSNPSRVSVVIMLDAVERVSNCEVTCGVLDRAILVFTDRGDMTDPVARATVENGRRARGSVEPGSLVVSVREDGSPRARVLDDYDLAIVVADEIMKVIG